MRQTPSLPKRIFDAATASPVRTALSTFAFLAASSGIAYGASCKAYSDCDTMPTEFMTWAAQNFLNPEQAYHAAEKITDKEFYAGVSTIVSATGSALAGTAQALFRCCTKKSDATADTQARVEEGKGEYRPLISQ